jgi:hypothetical protein
MALAQGFAATIGPAALKPVFPRVVVAELRCEGVKERRGAVGSKTTYKVGIAVADEAPLWTAESDEKDLSWVEVFTL